MVSVADGSAIDAERRIVLVADDDDAIRNIAARVISRLGLVPLHVSDGAAAVEMAVTCEGQLVCAILDVQMPILNGADAAYVLQSRFPDLAIVLMSGAIPEALVERIAQLRIVAILHKPFPLTALRDVLLRAAGVAWAG